MNDGGIDRPTPIGGPKPVGRKRRHLWTRGGIQDFVGGLRRGSYGHLSEKSVAAIAERVDQGAGANHEFSRSEVTDTAGAIVDEHLELGLTTSQAERLAEKFSEGPKA